MTSVWNTAESHSGTIQLQTHTAYLSVAGPPRIPSQPVVIVEAGHSDCSNTWTAVARAVSPFARIFTYDRAGYGQSSPSSSPRTAENIAAELSALLDAAEVAGPYVLVAHSYGGILAREFLALRTKDVAGMVLVDAVQEADEAAENVDAQWPWEALFAVVGKMDRIEVIGLPTTHKLTEEEWKVANEAEKQEGFEKTSGLESAEITPSAQTLRVKKQFDKCVMGSAPLSVIKGDNKRDIDLIYAAGLKEGNGTKEQQETLKKWLDIIDPIWEKNQKDQLRLSKNGRMVYAKNCGHNVHIQQPATVADEVKWVLGSL